MIGREELDPLAPQREAAIFYGLFLRGHPAEDLRRDSFGTAADFAFTVASTGAPASLS